MNKEQLIKLIKKAKDVFREGSDLQGMQHLDEAIIMLQLPSMDDLDDSQQQEQPSDIFQTWQQELKMIGNKLGVAKANKDKKGVARWSKAYSKHLKKRPS